jgi:hypothetical protein
MALRLGQTLRGARWDYRLVEKVSSVQIAERMAADKPPNSSEGHIAVEDARAHASTSVLRLHDFLGEMQGPTASLNVFKAEILPRAPSQPPKKWLVCCSKRTW